MDTGSIVMDDLATKGFCVLKCKFPWQELEKDFFLSSLLSNKEKHSDFFYSLLNYDIETNMAISFRVTEKFKSLLQPMFMNYRFLAGSFLIKPAHSLTEFFLHQDWSYTNEKIYTPITCWSPIIDTDNESGGMYFLSGSHKYFQTIRSKSYETSRFSLTEIGETNVTPVYMNRGDILLFDPSTWHGSFSNKRDKARMAFTCIMLPDQAPFYYYKKRNDDTAQVYKVPENSMECFLSDLIKEKIPPNFMEDDIVSYKDKHISLTELLVAHKIATS